MTLANTAPPPASAQQHARFPITFLFTVKNEQINLPYSLEALKDWAGQILILDCGSTDRTKEISEQYVPSFTSTNGWAMPVRRTGPWIICRSTIPGCLSLMPMKSSPPNSGKS
jgi:hypothetical protein